MFHILKTLLPRLESKATEIYFCSLYFSLVAIFPGGCFTLVGHGRCLLLLFFSYVLLSWTTKTLFDECRSFFSLLKTNLIIAFLLGKVLQFTRFDHSPTSFQTTISPSLSLHILRKLYTNQCIHSNYEQSYTSVEPISISLALSFSFCLYWIDASSIIFDIFVDHFPLSFFVFV